MKKILACGLILSTLMSIGSVCFADGGYKKYLDDAWANLESLDYELLQIEEAILPCKGYIMYYKHLIAQDETRLAKYNAKLKDLEADGKSVERVLLEEEIREINSKIFEMKTLLAEKEIQKESLEARKAITNRTKESIIKMMQSSSDSRHCQH